MIIDHFNNCHHWLVDLSPFTLETAIAKVRAGENAWNSRGPKTVSHTLSEIFSVIQGFGLRGTFPPSRRASLSPIAIACLRLLTFLPDLPDFNSPRFISCIARPTFCEALEPYFLLVFFDAIISPLFDFYRQFSLTWTKARSTPGLGNKCAVHS